MSLQKKESRHDMIFLCVSWCPIVCHEHAWQTSVFFSWSDTYGNNILWRGSVSVSFECSYSPICWWKTNKCSKSCPQKKSQSSRITVTKQNDGFKRKKLLIDKLLITVNNFLFLCRISTANEVGRFSGGSHHHTGKSSGDGVVNGTDGVSRGLTGYDILTRLGLTEGSGSDQYRGSVMSGTDDDTTSSASTTKWLMIYI